MRRQRPARPNSSVVSGRPPCSRCPGPRRYLCLIITARARHVVPFAQAPDIFEQRAQDRDGCGYDRDRRLGCSPVDEACYYV